MGTIEELEDRVKELEAKLNGERNFFIRSAEFGGNLSDRHDNNGMAQFTPNHSHWEKMRFHPASP